MRILRPIARGCRAVISVPLLALAVFGVASSDAAAQTGTLHAQVARLDDAAYTYTLGARYTTPLGDAGGSVLPEPGQQVERSGRRWLFTVMAGGGLSRSRGSSPKNKATAVGQAGFLYRFETLLESLGLVAYANLEPGLVGPAVTVRAFNILELLGGVGKLEDHSGASWFASAAVSVVLFGDLNR